MPYQDLPQDEMVRPHQPPSKSHREYCSVSGYSRFVLTILATFFGCGIAINLFHLAAKAPRQEKEAHLFNRRTCGNTPATAVEKGCIWDAVSFAWVPPECFDQSSKDAVNLEWKWYHDSDSEHIFSKDEMTTGKFKKGEAWVSAQYQEARCVYMWRAYHILTLKGAPIQDTMRKQDISEQCVGILLGAESSNLALVHLSVQYETCDSVGF